MSRPPSVWYWKARKAYYTTIRGKKIRLGTAKRAAEAELKRLLSQKQTILSGATVASVLDAFVVWTYENRAEKTASRYEEFCQSFVSEYGRLPIEKLGPKQITAWLTSKGWGNTTKRNAIAVLQRSLNWAVRNCGLEKNPIQGMEKPTIRPKRRFISPEEFDAILEHVKETDPFRDYLVLSYDSGGRPREIINLEARHLDLDNSRAIIPATEAKGGRVRCVYFPTKRSITILKRLAKEHPTGPLLLNTLGNPWDGQNVKSRFARLEKHTNQRWNAYSLRHGYATRKLKAGIDSHIVASLMGHVDTQMIHRVYSHVTDDPKFMLKQASKE